MALVECKECGNEISDTAAACPKCGASVPRTVGPDEEQCPHCMTVVHESATACPSCHAVKGYMYDSRYGSFGKVGTFVWAVALPLGLTVAFIAAEGPSWLAGLTLLWGAYGIYKLVTGPRWYKSRHAG